MKLGHLSFPKRLIKRMTLRWTDMTICISDWAREFFLQEYHAPTTGVVLFLVTSLAMNRGDPLLAVGAG